MFNYINSCKANLGVLWDQRVQLELAYRRRDQVKVPFGHLEMSELDPGMAVHQVVVQEALDFQVYQVCRDFQLCLADP